ncbi:hypothetical protein BLA29_001640 [Euroglyphus maynei]|uniref:Uncharacterized protein n=1 Tax=Euroglyphus maynei TaxID=6958 RepID=A0A1Y3B0Q5_EURMA|nr:hypothetical protein BLA29_001640 [Euroglyphus maynei]
MNHCSSFIVLTLILCIIKFQLYYGHYPNTIYEASSDDDDEYEFDDDDFGRSYGTNDYMSDGEPITDKRRSIHPIRLDPELLQEHLYNIKSNVLNGSEVSTLKNKNFTWKLLKKDKYNNVVVKELKPALIFQSNLKDENKKTTDWIDLVSGVQSDQPAVSPSMNTDNQTSVPSDNNEDDDNDDDEMKKDGDKIQASSPNQNPKTANVDSKLIPTDKNNVNPYVSVGNRTNSFNNNYQPISSNPYWNSRFPGVVNKPFYPRFQQSNRPYYRQQQQQPIIASSNQKPYYLYQSNISTDTTANTKRNWTCQMSSYNNCSIVNDPQTGPLFQLNDYNYFPYQSSSKPEWYLVLNTTTFPANKIGARLITPYLPHNRASKGCLTLKFITTGNELEKIMIHQQDIDDKCIYSGSLSSPLSSPSIGSGARMVRQQSERLIEHNVDLTIDLRQSDPRFFIEVYVKRLTTRQSSFAFSKMNLAYEQSCQNDQSNNCFPSAYPNGGAANAVNRPIKRDQIPVEP